LSSDFGSIVRVAIEFDVSGEFVGEVASTSRALWVRWWRRPRSRLRVKARVTARWR
jgi:hypothetical protein